MKKFLFQKQNLRTLSQGSFQPNLCIILRYALKFVANHSIYNLFMTSRSDSFTFKLLVVILLLGALASAQNSTVTYTYVDPETNQTVTVTRRTIQTQTVETIYRNSTSVIDSNHTSTAVTNSSSITSYPNCQENNGFICVLCKEGYILREGYCFVGIVGCEALGEMYLPGTNVLKCKTCSSHFRNADGVCKDDNCIQTSKATGLCSRCREGFSFNFFHYACIDPNCLERNQGKCSQCRPGYYEHESSEYCLQKQTFNCLNYPSQVCDGCPDNFFLLIDQRTCTKIIKGCHTHSVETGQCLRCMNGLERRLINGVFQCIDSKCDGSYPCVKCLSGYESDNGICRDKNCRNYDEGNCTQCANGYLLVENYCQQPLSHCSSFNADGACVRCDEGFMLKNGLCFLIPLQGCERRNQTVLKECEICSQGFYLNKDNTCSRVSYLCAQFDYENKNCKVCRAGATLDKGACVDVYCQEKNEIQCTRCVKDYVFVKNTQICRYNDPNCDSFNENFVCTSCKRNYVPNADNTKCELLCLAYESNGVCSQCNARYYLDNNRKCLLKPQNCHRVDPATGVCIACIANYYLKDERCHLNPVGCATFNAQDGVCFNCFGGYRKTSAGLCQYIPRDPKCQFGRVVESEEICEACKNNTYELRDGKCVLPYCQEYESRNIERCSKCSPEGYLENGYCYYLPNNCTQTTNGVCSKCENGFTLQGNSCYRNLPGCQLYDSTTKKCMRCQDKYYLQAGVCTDINCAERKDGECVKCFSGFRFNSDRFCEDINCEKVVAGSCHQCQNGYFLRQSENLCYRIEGANCIQTVTPQCNICPANYIYSPLVGCIKRVAGCQAQSDYRCDRCLPGLRLSNNVCYDDKCQTNSASYPCSTCRAGLRKDINNVCIDPYCTVYNEGICNQCIQGFDLQNGVCVGLPQGCARFVNGQCGACLANYFLLDKTCYRVNPLNCQRYVRPDCNQCPPSFIFVENIGCEKKIVGCSAQAYNLCSSCISGLTLNPNRSQCLNVNCEITNQNPCQKCKSGYFLVVDGGNNFCLELPPHCLRVNIAGVCQSCANGYDLIRGTCYTAIDYCEQRNPIIPERCGRCISNYYVDNQYSCSIRQVQTAP